jgi:hypothetical protein
VWIQQLHDTLQSDRVRGGHTDAYLALIFRPCTTSEFYSQAAKCEEFVTVLSRFLCSAQPPTSFFYHFKLTLNVVPVLLQYITVSATT